MGNLAGWPYWKVISLTGQAGAGTDYQVKFEVGDSAGGSVHLEGHCTNFPQDIRITDDDGTTLLDHWVEDLTADPIVVHIEVKDDLGSNQDVRIYYGKNGETTASNGDTTFPFFDDFTGDLSKWSTSGAPSIISNVLTLTDDDNVLSDTLFGYGYAFESLAKADEQDSGLINAMDSIPGAVNSIHIFNADSYAVNDFDRFGLVSYASGSNTTTQVDVWNDFRTQYRRYNILRPAANDITYIQDEHSYHQTTGHIPTVNLGLAFRVWDSSQESTMEVQWGFVRKYNSPEPTFSSAGAEQSAAGAPTGIFYGPLAGPFGGPI